MPGILGIKESLPTQPLSGMLNKHGGKVRLTFKLENDQVWIGKFSNLNFHYDELPGKFIEGDCLSGIRNTMSCNIIYLHL